LTTSCRRTARGAFGFKYGDEFYLFSSKETMEKFKTSPQTYAAGVRQAMSQLDTADGVVRR
jgi:YHS domain-containing protein